MSTIKQNPQIKRTKRLLQDALIELLKEKQYQKITVTDIVTRAGLSRTTFYAHYDYKEELIEQCLEDLLAVIFYDSFSNVQSFPSSPNGNAFPPSPMQERGSISNLVRHWKNNHSLFRTFEEAGLEKIILKIYMEQHQLIFQEKLKERLPFTPNQELIDYYLVFLSSTQVGILQHWLATNMEMPVETLIDFLTVVNSPSLFLKLIR
jgi:AcrR family transcriptional regulator